MKKKDFIKMADISENCITNRGTNKYVFTANIDRICKTVKCTPNDVFQFCASDER